MNQIYPSNQRHSFSFNIPPKVNFFTSSWAIIWFYFSSPTRNQILPQTFHLCTFFTSILPSIFFSRTFIIHFTVNIYFAFPIVSNTRRHTRRTYKYNNYSTHNIPPGLLRYTNTKKMQHVHTFFMFIFDQPLNISYSCCNPT